MTDLDYKVMFLDMGCVPPTMQPWSGDEGDATTIMTLKQFFKEFTNDELVELYKRIKNVDSRNEVKYLLMNRLDIPDNDSFYLWIKLQ